MRSWHWCGDAATLAGEGAVQARPRAGLDYGGTARSGDRCRRTGRGREERVVPRTWRFYRKANTSRRNQAHRIYPYRLRHLTIDRPNQVWAMDTTYIPMQRGFVYLTAVLDWATRRVLAWRLSNTLTADPCVEALEEAIQKYGAPQIMNTDQGSQLTSAALIDVVEHNGIEISMDGKGCWRDNVFVERLWKSVKYEEVYLHGYETVSIARQALNRYFDFYNRRRPHSTFDGKTPDTAYFSLSQPPLAAGLKPRQRYIT